MGPERLIAGRWCTPYVEDDGQTVYHNWGAIAKRLAVLLKLEKD
jgi:hypothetical protein